MKTFSSDVSVRRGPIPSGHSVRDLPSSLTSIFRIRDGLFNLSVSKPRIMAGASSGLSDKGLPRASTPVAEPDHK